MIRRILLLSVFLVISIAGNAQNSPTEAAPTPPARDAADVISLFSDAYSDITIGTFSAEWDDSDIADTTISGNAVKKITFTNFIGVDFSTNRQDFSGMTHFHMDFWTAETDLVGKVFNSKFSHWAGGNGEASALELNINTGTNPAIQSGTWVSIDVPFSSFTNTPNARDDVAQFLISSNLGVVFVDNIYVYKDDNSSGNEETPTGDGNELLINGDFESGSNAWYGNAVDVRTEGENSYNFANVAAAGNPFDVNLSQRGITLTPDGSYVLSFQASTGAGNQRTLLVGIGQSESPFQANVKTVTLTDTVQTFTLALKATDLGTNAPFGGSDNRVIFDMGADVGVVVLDNISLQAEDQTGTSVDDDNLPTQFVLNQNYPNPFNPTTNISYSIPTASNVSLEVFNLQGQRVASLVNGFQSSGAHSVNFDASNLSSGVYIYRLRAGNNVMMNKMTLIK